MQHTNAVKEVRKIRLSLDSCTGVHITEILIACTYASF